MRRQLCRLARGAPVLAVACLLGLAPSVEARAKFTASLQSTIHDVVDLIGVGVDVKLPKRDIHQLNHALQDLMRVLEAPVQHRKHESGFAGPMNVGLKHLSQSGRQHTSHQTLVQPAGRDFLDRGIKSTGQLACGPNGRKGGGSSGGGGKGSGSSGKGGMSQGCNFAGSQGGIGGQAGKQFARNGGKNSAGGAGKNQQGQGGFFGQGMKNMCQMGGGAGGPKTGNKGSTGPKGGTGMTCNIANTHNAIGTQAGKNAGKNGGGKSLASKGGNNKMPTTLSMTQGTKGPFGVNTGVMKNGGGNNAAAKGGGKNGGMTGGNAAAKGSGKNGGMANNQFVGQFGGMNKGAAKGGNVGPGSLNLGAHYQQMLTSARNGKGGAGGKHR